MNKEQIFKTIKSEYNGDNYSRIISELSNSYGQSEDVIKKHINSLLEEGLLCNTSKKKIWVSADVGYKKGTLQVTRKGTGFLLCDDNSEDIFIPRDKLNGANSGDIVFVQQDYENGEFITRGEVKKIVKHSVSRLVGTIDILKTIAFLKPDNSLFTSRVKIPLNKTGGALNGDKVYVEITSWGDREVTAQVIEVLGQAENVDTDVLSICRNYDLREEFPDYVMEIAKRVSQTVSEKNKVGRTDLTNEIIFTIDGIDTRDIDDAISLSRSPKGNYILGVHIADVGHYVPLNSVLDREAYLRGTSVYFPNNVFPMLPRELSNGICSLNEGVERLTLSCVMEIDKNGEVIDSKIFESFIKSRHKMTYDDCNAIIKGDEKLREKYSDITPILLEMEKLMYILEDRREKHGAIVFDIPELQIILNDKKEIETFKAKSHDIAERIIESFMVSANETVARTFKAKKVPFVYRIHESPDIQKIEGFQDFISGFGDKFTFSGDEVHNTDIADFLSGIKDKPYKQVANRVLLRCMSKAKYSPEPIGHFALGLKDYTHFTSPIRRYCDLTIHRIIKKCINDKITGAYEKQLINIVSDSATRASLTETTADKCERDVDDYFKARYMKDKIGTEYTGTISGTIDSGIFVELDNTVEGFVPVMELPGYGYKNDDIRHMLSNGHNKYQMGDKINVIVSSVDILSRKINFSLKSNNADIGDIELLFADEFNKKKKNYSNPKNDFSPKKSGKKPNKNTKSYNNKHNGKKNKNSKSSKKNNTKKW